MLAHAVILFDLIEFVLDESWDAMDCRRAAETLYLARERECAIVYVVGCAPLPW